MNKPRLKAPAMMLQTFTHVLKPETIGRRAQPVESDIGGLEFQGVLTAYNAGRRLQLQQAQHPITHTIVVFSSPPAAVEGDFFEQGQRLFRIHGIGDPGDMGAVTVYEVEEKKGQP
jgi:hypothetical protein